MIRNCTECGAEFTCSPSDKKVTCSKECSRQRRSRLLQKHEVTESTRQAISKTAKKQDRSTVLSKGTPAAMQSPKAGRFVTNSSAKKWYLINPDGRRYVCINLNQFIREHAADFGVPVDSDKDVDRIAGCFRTVKCLIKQGKNCTIYGWSIVDWDDRKQCEIKK